MNKILGMIALSVFTLGCNINPSKEARIQQLETEVQQSMEKINQLESRIETLEELNAGLQSKIEEMDSD